MSDYDDNPKLILTQDIKAYRKEHAIGGPVFQYIWAVFVLVLKIALPFVALLYLWHFDMLEVCKPHEACHDKVIQRNIAEKEALARGELDMPHKVGRFLAGQK